MEIPQQLRLHIPPLLKKMVLDDSQQVERERRLVAGRACVCVCVCVLEAAVAAAAGRQLLWLCWNQRSLRGLLLPALPACAFTSMASESVPVHPPLCLALR